MTIGVYVGRFQPFHLGHLAAVKFALRKVDLLYIVVGSAQKSHEPDNPFTAGERIAMVKAALDEAGVDCRKWLIIPVPDATAHAVWTAYIDLMIPKYDVVFSNNPLTLRLFKEKGCSTVEVPLQQRALYQATEIRRRILKGASWAQLVPKSVAQIIREIKGEQRIRSLKTGFKTLIKSA